MYIVILDNIVLNIMLYHSWFNMVYNKYISMLSMVLFIWLNMYEYHDIKWFSMLINHLYCIIFIMSYSIFKWYLAIFVCYRTYYISSYIGT